MSSPTAKQTPPPWALTVLFAVLVEIAQTAAQAGATLSGEPGPTPQIPTAASPDEARQRRRRA